MGYGEAPWVFKGRCGTLAPRLVKTAASSRPWPSMCSQGRVADEPRPAGRRAARATRPLLYPRIALMCSLEMRCCKGARAAARRTRGAP
eukprot:263164-Chlamydomonas_euryale.AAC.2